MNKLCNNHYRIRNINIKMKRKEQKINISHYCPTKIDLLEQNASLIVPALQMDNSQWKETQGNRRVQFTSMKGTMLLDPCS